VAEALTQDPTREEMILDGLNEAQHGAVLHGEGPLLIPIFYSSRPCRPRELLFLS